MLWFKRIVAIALGIFGILLFLTQFPYQESTGNPLVSEPFQFNGETISIIKFKGIKLELHLPPNNQWVLTKKEELQTDMGMVTFVKEDKSQAFSVILTPDALAEGSPSQFLIEVSTYAKKENCAEQVISKTENEAYVSFYCPDQVFPYRMTRAVYEKSFAYLVSDGRKSKISDSTRAEILSRTRVIQ